MKVPPLTELVALCAGCNHWQVDFTPRAVKGRSFEEVLRDVVRDLHGPHVQNDCPRGITGRIKVMGQWVEPPSMSDDKPADAALAFQPLPRWWVWR